MVTDLDYKCKLTLATSPEANQEPWDRQRTQVVITKWEDDIILHRGLITWRWWQDNVSSFCSRQPTALSSKSRFVLGGIFILHWPNLAKTYVLIFEIKTGWLWNRSVINIHWVTWLLCICLICMRNKLFCFLFSPLVYSLYVNKIIFDNISWHLWIYIFIKIT